MKKESKFKKFLGYRFFKEVGDKIEQIRVIKVTTKFIVEDSETKEVKKLSFDQLKEYTPLEPRGVVVFIRCWINDGDKRIDDVIVSLYDMLQIKIKDGNPYAICRQGVNDIFYDMIKKVDEVMTGFCVSYEECPKKQLYMQMQYCDGVDDSQFVNFYMDDTIDDILNCIDTTDYDILLSTNMKAAMNSDLYVTTKKINQYKGWCKDLHTLLIENAFDTEMDALRNIVCVENKLTPNIIHIENDNGAYDIFDDRVNLLISQIVKANVVKTLCIEFDYDIDLAEFNNDNYIYLRDSDNKLYLAVYTIEGEFIEAELLEEINKISPSDRVRLKFYNKYIENPEIFN